MQELDTLTAQVAATKTAADTAVALINDLAAKVAAGNVDPAQLQSLTDNLKTATDALSAAVIAHTA